MARSSGAPSAVLFAWRWLVGAGWLWDWLLAAALVCINFNIPGGSLCPAVERLYFTDDPALRYPAVESWLNEQQKFPVEFGVPLAVAALSQVLLGSGSSSSSSGGAAAADLHHFALALLEGFAIETSFKKWMNLVGKQRPDWFVRLASGDPDKIREGRTSYPSGHAAETTMTFGLLALYLLARLRLFTRQSQGHFAKVMLCLAPLGFAAFITMSRVAAYKHDWSDVNAGFIIGMWSGFLAYLINYGSPFDDATAARPRLRALPPAPAWLHRALGVPLAAQEAPAGAAAEDDDGGGGGGGGGVRTALLA